MYRRMTSRLKKTHSSIKIVLDAVKKNYRRESVRLWILKYHMFDKKKNKKNGHIG